MRRYPRDAAEGATPGEAGQERGRVAAGGRQLRARVGRAGGLQAGAAVRVGGVHEGQPRAPGGPADGGRCGRQGRVRRSAAAEAGGRAEEAAGGDAAEEAGAAVRRDAGEGAEGGEQAGKERRIVHLPYADHLHGKDSSRQRCAEQRRKTCRHAAHGHNVAVLLVHSRPMA